MSDIVTKASEFARTAHESIDQRRKYSHEPYIVHPTAVAAIVASVTDDEATIAAAWLHDVVEDTPITIEEVESEFGSDIARLVADLTDVSQRSDGNRKQRLAVDRQHTREADPRAKTVKLADVIHNLTDIVKQDTRFAVTYVQEKELLLKVLHEGDATLYKRAVVVIETSKKMLANADSR